MKRLSSFIATAVAAGTIGFSLANYTHRGAQAHVGPASPSPSQATTAPAPASFPSAIPVADDARVIVNGRVVDDRGRPVAGAVVVARDLDDGFVFASSPDRPVDPTAEGVLTGADGRFSVADLPPGRYVFVAIFGHHSPGRSGPVVVAGSGRALSIQIALAAETIRA